MKTVIINVGDHVLVDPCRWSGGPAPMWRVGVVERKLEIDPPRFLIRYLAPDENGLRFQIHTPRSIRAVGDEVYVRRVLAGVIKHVKGFARQRERIERDRRANERHWATYSRAEHAIDDRERELWGNEQGAMRVLRQPGLLRWTARGGLKIG